MRIFLLLELVTLLYSGARAAELYRELMPWQIPWLQTHSPSYRQGSDFTSSVSFQVIDPNTIDAVESIEFPNPLPKFPPSTANCSVSWDPRAGDPYDVVQPCGGPGNWTFQIAHTGNLSEWQSPTDGFVLRINLTESLVYDGTTVLKSFVAEQPVNGEFLAGSCGGSGVCNWHLRPRHTPLLVAQNMTACEGDCYMNTA